MGQGQRDEKEEETREQRGEVCQVFPSQPYGQLLSPECSTYSISTRSCDLSVMQVALKRG